MQNATYAFMINLSVADCIELMTIGLYAGVTILIKYEDPAVGRVASFLCQTTWYANCVLFPVIAFSRWIAITKPHLAPLVFTKRNLWAIHIGAWLLLGIPCFYANIIYPADRLFPFLPSFYTWGFDPTNPLAHGYNWLNMVFDSCCTTVEVCFNVLSLIWVHQTRKQVQTVTTSKNRKREIKLLIQSVILGSIFTATYIIFTVAAFMPVVTVNLCLLFQGVFTFNHSVNPMIYLSVNARLREKVIELLTCGKVKFANNTLNAPMNNPAQKPPT